MTMQPEKTPERPETLAERSARLEAEAKALGEGKGTESAPPEASSPAPAPAADVTALEAELSQTKDQMIRALAEVENMRKRAAREREDAGKYAATSFAKDMIDIADNLRRALHAIPADLLENEQRVRNLVEGLEATERTLLKNFEKHGIYKIEPLDQPFNPNFHEVMFEAPLPGKAAGTIIQVMEAGYTIHDRLLRPARVGVVKDDGQDTSGPTHPGGHVDTSA